IAMPGPWVPEATPGHAPAASILPALPALTALLRRARRLPDATDWRAGVMTALGAAEPVAAAAVAARACGLPEGTALCLAAPLHLTAGISRVHLPPGGQLQLDAAEELAWCAAINAEFGAEGLVLHVAAPGGGWLLQAPFAAAARDAAPETLVGAALQRRPAEGSHERALRRLAAEAEMWLAAPHRLNEVRRARGQPTLDALWFWGGASARALPSLQLPAGIAASGVADAWLAGLAAHAGRRLQAAPDFDAALAATALHAPPQAAAATRTGTVLLVPAPDNQGPSGHYWQMVEDNWIAPAVRAFEAGELAGLRLQIGRTAWQVPRGRFLRWLRRPRGAWWQLTGEECP